MGISGEEHSRVTRKMYGGIEKGTKTVGIGGQFAVLAQSSIVKRMRAAVVVARANRPRRDHFEQYERI